MKSSMVHTMGMLTLAMTLPLSSADAQRVAAGSHSTESAKEARIRASEALLDRRVDVAFKRTTLSQAIDALASKAKVPIVYRAELVEAYDLLVTFAGNSVRLSEALARVLSGTTLRAVPVPGGRLALVDGRSHDVSTDGVVTGKIIDAKSREPLRGVTITIDDATKGVTTNADGIFRITSLAAGDHRLTVRMPGYARQIRVVHVRDGETTSADVSMESRATALDQVVVTGTVVATELKGVPSAITVITAKQLEERGIRKIDQLFRGDVPGLFALNNGSSAKVDEVTMYSRGATNIGTNYNNDQNTNTIKTYVDGVEMADSKYLSQIDPQSIERIEILSGPQASTIYGSNAINGVMQIFTKRGMTTRPQLSLALTSGYTENNFNRSFAPTHNANLRVAGVEGRWSYDVGGSIDYAGAWTPGKQTTRYAGSGGGRMAWKALTADLSFRQGYTNNRQRASGDQRLIELAADGIYNPAQYQSIEYARRQTLNGRTAGVTLGYTPVERWSHQVVIGNDVSATEAISPTITYARPSDSTLRYSQSIATRSSQRYTTTLVLPVTSAGNLTLTSGVDHWRTNLLSTSATPVSSLTGTLAGATLTRGKPDKNHGGFLQTQIGLWDALFVTYGLRAEWNPAFGDEAQPNLAPRYGAAYTRDVRGATVKLRASYGRSTRPPNPEFKRGVLLSQGASYMLSSYADFMRTLENHDLGPEFQQGGEGGVEVYFGNRGSLVVTRYNQTVDGIVANVNVDSVRSLTAYPNSGDTGYDTDFYRYAYQYQFINVANIRNQGWELQGVLNTGPLAFRGTYSWTKSRVLGVTPEYRARVEATSFGFRYKPGQPFNYVAEHTWAAGVTYAHRATSLGFAFSGTGKLYTFGETSMMLFYGSGARALDLRPRVTFPDVTFYEMAPSYVMTDLNAAHQFAQRIFATLQVQNLTNHYQNDVNVISPTAGRQTRLGLRIIM
jgi:outer membrane receptor protein involved in Fe transport